MDFPCIGSLVDLEKELGSKISRYYVFSLFCSIDFDLGAFELSDGRCYLICGTAIDDYYWKVDRYILDSDVVASRTPSGKIDLYDRITGNKIW